jgi:FMN phosphatase YigB (HAD superfamily)
MKLTLLLDLDGTLLDIQMDTFLQAYFQALTRFLSPYVSPELLLPALMQGTWQMFANRDPRRTLRQAFNQTFFPQIRIEPQALMPAIDRFYEEIFPTLRAFAQPRPDARRLVEWAFEQGHRVAITTNPIFPRRAIEHRLTWAGLPPERYPFELITSYEDFHFCKPAIEYYAEVLGRLAWPQGPVIMIGDDRDLDIRPARALSLTTCWIAPAGASPAPSDHGVAYASLGEALTWLQAFSAAPNGVPPLEPPALLALLRATPAVILHWIERYPLASWRVRPYPEEWCALEVLAHLRDVEKEVTLPRLERILHQENPFLPSQDTDRWAEERRYREQERSTVLQDYLEARLELLQKLEALTPDQWQRPARHSIFGPLTLQGWINLIAEHDRQHLSQMHEALRLAENAGSSLPD